MSVIVYSAPWCSGCKVVKQALTRAEIQFEEIDITTTDGGRKALELGIKSIPVTTVTSGKTFIGSKADTIKSILEAIND